MFPRFASWIRNLFRRDTHCVRWRRPLLGQGEVSKKELLSRNYVVKLLCESGFYNRGL